MISGPIGASRRYGAVVVLFATLISSSCSTQNIGTAGQATFQGTGNQACTKDYRKAAALLEAPSEGPNSLLSLVISLRRELATDVSDIPHPAEDNANLAVIQADTDVTTTFMQNNLADLAQGTIPFPASVIQETAELELAYRNLQLTACIVPSVPGVPRGVAP